MHIERDALHTRVFPLLNEQAAQYSEAFTGIDLRWGIQTSLLSEEEADKKAFLTCFDEIDSSRPYFIAFIGDRYGTNVDESSILRIFNLVLNKDKMTKSEVNEFIKKTSITQKEIEYAAFVSKIAPSNCFFFFRTGYGKTLTEKEKETWIESDKESKEKLDKLKNQIKKKFPNSFCEYSLGYSKDKGFFLPESEIQKFKDCLFGTFLKEYKKKNNIEIQKQEENSKIDNIQINGTNKKLETEEKHLVKYKESLWSKIKKNLKSIVDKIKDKTYRNTNEKQNYEFSANNDYSLEKEKNKTTLQTEKFKSKIRIKNNAQKPLKVAKSQKITDINNSNKKENSITLDI